MNHKTETFKINPAAFKEVRRRVLVQSVPVLLLAGILGIVMSNWDPSTSKGGWVGLVYYVILFSSIVFFVLRHSLDRQHELFKSFTITVSEDAIVREQKDTPTVRIPISSIKSIVKRKDGCMIVMGETQSEVIGIPLQIENRTKLENTLGKMKLITSGADPSIIQKYPALLSPVFIIMMLIVYLGTNKILVGVVGVILVGVMIWALVEIQRSKHLDKRHKRLSMFCFVLVIASLVAAMYYKITA